MDIKNLLCFSILNNLVLKARYLRLAFLFLNENKLCIKINILIKCFIFVYN